MRITTFLRKLLGRIVVASRTLPGFAARERALYATIEASFVAAPAAADSIPWSPLPPAPVVREVLSDPGRARVIDLSALSADDEAFFHQLGLNALFAVANRAADPSDIDVRPACSLIAEAEGPPSTAFQRTAFASRRLAAVCPWSGKALSSQHSLLAEQGAPIFYYFAGREPFFLAVGREGQGYIKLYLYLLRHGVVLLLAPSYWWRGFGELNQMRAWFIAERRRVVRYLAVREPRQACALLDKAHFAHHLWNTLTGLEQAIESEALFGVDRLIVSGEPFGPVEEIFPELNRLSILRLRFPEVIDRALAEHWWLLRPGGTRISERLIARIRGVARAHVRRERMELAAALRAKHWPILWATIRTGNRRWVQQVEGIATIAELLATRWPRAALIIDGFSIPYGAPAVSARDQDKLIAQERRVVEAIRERCARGRASAMPVISLVGEPLFDAVVYAEIADVYVAHHGSLQHKIGWLGTCPGVVHGNRFTLSLTDLRLRDAALYARPGGIAPRYLAPNLVTDRPSTDVIVNDRWPRDIDDYALDSTILFQELVSILNASGERD